MKKIVAVLLAVLITLSTCAMAEMVENVTYLDYHDYTQFPLEGYEGETLSVAVRGGSISVPMEDTWFWPWFQSIVGVELDIEMVPFSSVAEKLNLYFASGDLPDVLMGFGTGAGGASAQAGISTDDLVMYGVEEGMFLALNDYIMNPDIMPNAYKFFTEIRPEDFAALQAPDGNIYSLGYHSNPDAGETTRTFIDQNLLDELGVAVPKTLDAFIDFLYKVKEKYPDMTPLGGSQQQYDISYYILNALGFVSSAGQYNDGTLVAIRDNEAVLPVTTDVYKEFLTIMNKFYTDGIISQDYFTMDGVTLDALMAEGQLAVYPYPPFVVNSEYDFFSHWTSVEPLTSQWNDKQQWPKVTTVTSGGFVVSADCENPELAMRIADAFYDCRMGGFGWSGPQYGSDYSNAVKDQGNDWGYYLDKDQRRHRVYYDGTVDPAMSTVDWGCNVGGGFLSEWWGNAVEMLDDSGTSYFNMTYQLYGFAERTYDPSNGDNNFRLSMFEHIKPYIVDTVYPSLVYMSAEDTLRMDELKSVLDPYIKGEIAKFITGKRSLDEFDAFEQEIRDMGVEEYQQFYTDNYSAFKAKIAG